MIPHEKTGRNSSLVMTLRTRSFLMVQGMIRNAKPAEERPLRDPRGRSCHPNIYKILFNKLVSGNDT